MLYILPKRECVAILFYFHENVVLKMQLGYLINAINLFFCMNHSPFAIFL